MIVFNTPIDVNKQGSSKRNYTDYKTIKSIEGEWLVNFDPNWGGPGEVTFPVLADWSQHSNKGIKYYSGTAVYNKVFNIDFEPQKDKRYFLQLENVKDVGIAEVKINGKDKGVLWTKPFRIEISKELKKGENRLEIKIVNSWFNRVAGDEMFPDKNQLSSTNIVLINNFRGRSRKEIPLEPSGLIGPVTIEEAVIK